MNTNAPRFTAMSLRTTAIVAGVGLLLMAVLSAIAYLNTFQSLVKFDDAALTAQNIMNSMAAFRMCILLLFTVGILDVVVAWEMCILVRATNVRLSALATWWRVIYAAVLIFNI